MIYETDCFALQMNFVNIYVKMTQTLAGDADAFKPLSPSLPPCLPVSTQPPPPLNKLDDHPRITLTPSESQRGSVGADRDAQRELRGFRIKNQRQL